MISEPPTNAAEAFKSAGLDLAALAAQQRKQMEVNRGTMPVNGERSKTVAPMQKAMICWNCKTALPDGSETIYCPKCQAEKDAQATKEQKTSVVVRVASIGDDFPRRHVDALATFHGPALEKAKELMQRILDGSLLLLYGLPGCGKTGMATWWEWKRLSAGKTAGRFMTAQGFFSEIKATWHPKAEKTEAALIQEFRKSRYTVIDEADERSESQWENRTLFDLINHTYNDQRTLVLISNLTFEQLQRTWTAKVLDRINEAGGMVECDWGNYREVPRHV